MRKAVWISVPIFVFLGCAALEKPARMQQGVVEVPILSPQAGADATAGRDVNYSDWRVGVTVVAAAIIYMIFNEGRDLVRRRNGCETRVKGAS